MARDAADGRAGVREWVGLGVIALPCIIYAMDLTVLNLAIPQITVALRPTAAELLWIADIYGFLIAGLLLVMGALGDRIGRRKLLLLGALGFGLTSAVAAFAPTPGALIAARAALGVAGATLAPSTLSLISTLFTDEKQRRFAISVWIASFSFGGAVGPIIGGVILAHFWWGAVFLAAEPVMILLLILGPICLPEYRAPQAEPIDWASALLCTVAVLAVVYGIKRVAEGDAPAPALAAIALGLAVGLAFLRRQTVLAAPLLDLKLFGAPGLSTALLINVVSFFVGFGSFLMTAQYLQLVLGLSPLAAGLWSLPAGLGFVAGSFLTTPLSNRMRPAYALALGLGVSAIGFATMAAAGGGRGLVLLAVGNLIVSLGMAPCAAIAADLVVGAAPPEKAGVASGLNETSSEFGGALGIALMGSAMTFLYRSQLQRALPSGLSPSLVEAALRTLGGATAAGRLLPDHGQALAAAARQSYAEAFRTTALGGAIILAMSAAAAAAVLRRKDAGSV